ncbi:hypothetical protein [Cryobacterium sp. MLB-32]|uniref:hypothetical protein n=1 Tax=Cryobacterium sp. MLB-32 TaxID=1529318 RepID=UPI0012E00082|nr:hypothetical protein [Cryobacterium sp. MLB-32]
MTNPRPSRRSASLGVACAVAAVLSACLPIVSGSLPLIIGGSVLALGLLAAAGVFAGGSVAQTRAETAATGGGPLVSTRRSPAAYRARPAEDPAPSDDATRTDRAH